MPDDYAADLELFAQLVADVQGSAPYRKWEQANPNGDAPKWRTFRDGLLTGKTPKPPTMATPYGRALVAAGMQHMSISRLVGEVRNPYPPTPPEQPPPAGVPSVPAGLAASVVGNDVTLTWSSNASAEQVDVYQVYRDGAVLNLSLPGLSYTDSDLADGTYSYRVSAHNVQGYGPWTVTPVSVTVGGVVIPPGGGTAIDTWEVQLTGSNPSFYDINRQSWLLYTYPLVPTGQYGGIPVGEFQTPQHDPVNGSWEWWYLYELYIPSSWNSSTEGGIAALPFDGHVVGGDVGWDQPGSSGVASTHMRYVSDDILLQHEYNTPNELIVKPNLTKNQWHSIACQFIHGRIDGTVPATGHPNGGAGLTRIYVDGPLAFQGTALNTLQRNTLTGNIQKRQTLLQGGYTPNINGLHTARFTAGRFGKTLAQAQSASGIGTFRDIFYASQGAIDHTWTQLTGANERTTGQFIAPQV